MHGLGKWPYYSDACRMAVDELLERGGSLSAYKANKDYGPEPSEHSHAWNIERDIEKRFGVKHAIVVNSGTAALHCALAALDLKGGEVITSPYTFSATASAILMAGGTPRFADVDPFNYCITPDTVKKCITKRTKAILPVHLFGYVQDMRGFKQLGIPIVEDACQAVGAHRAGKYSGSFGVAGCYSFNGTKNVPAGECGAMVTNSDRIAERARMLMNHACNFGKSYIGFNYRPNEVTSCIAYYGLRELQERNQRRIDLAGILAESRYFHRRMYRDWRADGSHVYYVYPFRILPTKHCSRAAFAFRMDAEGVQIGQGYVNPPIHHYRAFRKYCKKRLPVVDELAQKTLCLLSCVTPTASDSLIREVAMKIQGCL